jgi:hypothetical protein
MRCRVSSSLHIGWYARPPLWFKKTRKELLPHCVSPQVALNVGSPQRRNLSGVEGRADAFADIAKTTLMTQSCHFKAGFRATLVALG